jgi:sarcosine oxidase subunit gamma
VPELIAKPAVDHAALTFGSCTLTPVDLGPITSVALFPGQEKAAAKALKPLGLTFPAPNTLSHKDGTMLVWTGREQAFLIGVEAPDFGASAAVTDQSGGWSALRLTGAKAHDVLMRHVPLDLRLHAFPVGRAVRAPLGHMSAVLLRESDESFLVLTFRSMARTAWHEVETALRTVAARG